MSPLEAAELLGLAPGAQPAEIERAYQHRRAAAAPDDIPRQDALVRAREALLAAAPWQPPAAAPSPPAQPSANPAQAPQAYPSAQPQPPYPSAQPQYPLAQPPYPSAQPQPPYPSTQPAYPAHPFAPLPAPTPPPRRGLSAGAIIGISLGATALLLVVVLVVVVSLVSAVVPSVPSSGAAPAVPNTSAPSAPADDSMQPYDVDGVHVRPLDGWAFELTSVQACPGAVVTVGFSSTADGDVVQEWSEPVQLDANVPYYLTIPYSASTYQYAGIDAIQCQST